MRIRTRRNLKKKNVAIVFLFLLPLLGFATYASMVLTIIDDMCSYTFELDPPDNQYFYSEDEISLDRLAEMADILERRWDLYHSPTNISVDTTFTDYNYDTPEYYHPTDNGGQWTGMMLASECLRYKAAKNVNDLEELDDSIRLISKMVTCFSNFLAAPNGGIGPDYPGTPARFVAAPGQEDIFPFMFADDPIHYWGAGDYSDWRVRLYTSLDEMAGYIQGLGSVLKFVDPNDSETSRWCYERTRLLVAQLIEGFKKTNWLMISGDGNPAGTNINAVFGGGAWKLALLKMGAIAYPDEYQDDYEFTAAKELYNHQASMGSSWNVIMDYYALAFGVCVQWMLIILEEDPDLRMLHVNEFENGIYKICKYHRNGFVNAAHLNIMSLLSANVRKQFEDPQYTEEDIRLDIMDQLWRFHTSGWCPIRNYNLDQRPHSTRSTSLNPLIKEKTLDDTPQKWRDYFENNIVGRLYSWIDVEFNFDDHYIVPLTISEMGIDSLIWEENPFYGEGGNPNGDGLKENTGMSYLLVYWMCKAYNIF